MLPTLMLFRGGKPVKDFRLPVVKGDGAQRSVTRATMTEEVVTRFFELERRHLAALRRDEAHAVAAKTSAAVTAAAAASVTKTSTTTPTASGTAASKLLSSKATVGKKHQ